MTGDSGDQLIVRRVLPRGRNAVSREEVRHSQRTRLIESMIDVAAEKGFTSVTIADIVGSAGVAKPTFYDHFIDKEECFLTVYDLILEEVIAAIDSALDPEGSVEERVEQGIHGLIRYIATHDSRARIFLIESMRAGDAALERSSRASNVYASFYIGLREQFRKQHSDYPRISLTRAQAIVGAITEPLRACLRSGPAEDVLELEEEIVSAVRALAISPA